MHGRRQRERHKSARFPSPRDETPCRSFAHSNGPLSVDARHLRQLCEKSHCVLQPGPLSINTKPFRTSSLNTNTGGTYITLQLHKHDLGLSPERVFFFFLMGSESNAADCVTFRVQSCSSRLNYIKWISCTGCPP